ncbi:uncharacterized protein [Solanum lycopersicum]|uniref:uncharacterized protein n=1 Tax=Solanum lycopersicum TaxID=4081 RepID=UPI003748CD8B
MTEKEIVEVFVRVQEPDYYDRIMLLVGAKFAEIVKVGETIEDGLKSGKIALISASPGFSGLIRKRREEVAAVSYGGRKTPRNPSHSQDRSRHSPKSHRSYYLQSNHPDNHNTAPTYPNAQISSYQIELPSTSAHLSSPSSIISEPPPNYQAPVPNYKTNPYPQSQAPRSNARSYRQVPPSQQSGYDPSRPRFEKKPSRSFTALAESITKLFERLSAAGYIHLMGPKPVDVNSRFYIPEQRCAYHSNSVGHDTEDCINLKHKIQNFIDQEVAVASLSVREKGEFVILTPAKDVALVPSRTLAKPKFVIETAVALGMTRSGGCYTPDELSLGGQKKDHAKRPISEEEAEEFWRRMQPKDYSIVKHLEKTPAQISVWALLMSSWSHRQALMKASNDTYVPSGTSSDNVAAMIHQVIRGHRISFCDDELPAEGRAHKKALHITVISRGKIVNRVLVDDGSGLNICPLSTLKQLRFDLGKLEQNQVNVRVFVGVQRETLGAVTMTIQMGPAGFEAKFQVLYIDTSYNLFLGRPFIHMAGAVPSTLHQLMKLVWKNEELVIQGERSHSDSHVVRVQNDRHGNAAERIRTRFRIRKECPRDHRASSSPCSRIKVWFGFENQHKPNLKETETVNLGDSKCVKEVKISTYLNETQKESLVHLLAEYSNVFVWEVVDMQGLSTDVVSHKLPINPGFEPVKYKTRKFKPELSLKIKEVITKNIESRLLEVTKYPTWLANIVPVAKKDGKIRICVDYRDLNKTSTKDNFPLPNSIF